MLLAFADLANPKILAAACLTALEVAVAFALAAAVGVGGGLLIGLSAFAYRAFRPIVLLLFSVPKMVKPGLRKPRTNQASVNRSGPAMAPSAGQRAVSCTRAWGTAAVMLVMSSIAQRIPLSTID